MKKIISILLAALGLGACTPKEVPVSKPSFADQVNVFMGTSSDHGQLSPSATVPFGWVKAGPQTTKPNHSGYNYASTGFVGVTHNRIEGVGCRGAGGSILVSPVGGTGEMVKDTEIAVPGYYSVALQGGVRVEVTASATTAYHRYRAEVDTLVLEVDLTHSFARFLEAHYEEQGASIVGWVMAKNVCDKGAFRQRFQIVAQGGVFQKIDSTRFQIVLASPSGQFEIAVKLGDPLTGDQAWDFDRQKAAAQAAWNTVLGRIKVQGPDSLRSLFYSNLYRTLLAPHKLEDGRFHGWSVWDNFRTSMPLWSLAYPVEFQEVLDALTALYKTGKADWAREDEPAPTVRTEHSQIVLLDGYRKGYRVDFENILDSLLEEGRRLSFTSPDKVLESSYDLWALSEIAGILELPALSDSLLSKALDYKTTWRDKFMIMDENSDIMHGDGLYEGTLWQYRWFVPFHYKGIAGMVGGPDSLSGQLAYFFDHDLYNHGNQPDIQAPFIFNVLGKPWLTQQWARKILAEPMDQYYGTHDKWEKPYHGFIYNNRPEAYIPEMDDDAGTMSGWYVLASMGLYPACVGKPVYLISTPLFDSITLDLEKPFSITTERTGDKNQYIQEVSLNGKPLDRCFVSHDEIVKGGSLHYVLGDEPDPLFGQGMGYLEVWERDLE